MLRRKLHLVQREWGTDGIMGKLLNQVYQVFQVEVGLNGNIFDYSFEDYGDLATHGFFRNLWQLIRLYGVKFRIHATFDIPLLWEDNRSLTPVSSHKENWFVSTDIGTTKRSTVWDT